MNRISDSVAAFRKEVEKKFVELEQRIPKVDETNHTNDFNQLPKCRRISRLSCRQDSKMVEDQEMEQRPDVHSVKDAVTIVKSQTLKLNAAPSITEDPTVILVGEGLPEYEGKTPEMSSVTPFVSPRRGDILEWELGPYIPASPLKDFATGEIVGEARPSVVANSVQAGSSLKTTHPVQVKLSDREAEGAARAAGKSSLEARNLPTGGWTRFPS